MYNEISNNAQMTINTWLNLFGKCYVQFVILNTVHNFNKFKTPGASTMAAGGLVTGALVFIVAGMLVSPIMGPILGIA